LAHSSRGWTGARTPQALKRVRQSARRHAILQPRRSAAKTLVVKAVAASQQGEAEMTRAALTEAISALDRAAKVGAIHQNAADRRKSRLTLKLNAALGGEALAAGAHSARQTGKAAAAKAAKTRIAAGKAVKAKGEQTAAGKARAALSRTTRSGAAVTEPTTANAATTAKSAAKPAAKASAPKSTAKAPAKASAPKSTAQASATRSTAKAPAKAPAAKSTAKSASSKKS
jgi:ribosomal protein S20